MYKDRPYFGNGGPNWSKLGSFVDKHNTSRVVDQLLDKMGGKLCNSDFSLLSMPLVSSVKNQSKLPRSLLFADQCLDRVIVLSRTI